MDIESVGTGSKPDRESRPFLVATTTILGLIVFYFVFLDHNIRSAKISSISAREEEFVRAADLALIGYTEDHGERYPNLSGDMVATLRPYIKDPKVIEAMKRFEWNEKLSGKDPNKLEDQSTQWVLYSCAPDTENYAVGFADGSSHHASSGYLALILRGKAEMPWASPRVVIEMPDDKPMTAAPKKKK